MDGLHEYRPGVSDYHDTQYTGRTPGHVLRATGKHAESFAASILLVPAAHMQT